MKIMIILACCLSLVFSTLNGPAARVDETGGEQNVESEKPGDSTKPTPLPAETESYKLTPDTFDENLLRYVASVTKGSYMVSPLSFRYALSLLLAGASGDTKTELMTALSVASEEEWEAVCLAFNSFASEYTSSATKELDQFREWKKQGFVSANDPEPSRALRVANSVWKRDDILADFTAKYRDKIGKCYAAEYFTFTERNAVEKINNWADEKTEGLIPKLLPADYDTSELAVVLMNALYYKNSWIEPFPNHLTEDGDFTMKDGTVTTKTYMKNEERFAYYEDKTTQLVVLPMKDNVYMAYVLGSTENLEDKLAGAEETMVRVTVPKIDLETSFEDKELVDFLKACGVSLAFDRVNADFSAMIDHDIWVDDIIQKTRLKTDETGVEAAAVTAIMVKETCVIEKPENPKVFTADRPFSFYIYTTVKDVNQLMFAGEIID